MTLLCFNHNIQITAPLLPTKKIDFFELTVVAKGELVYFIDHVQYRVREGDGVFLPLGSLRLRPQSSVPCTYYSFNFLTSNEIQLPIFIPNAFNNERKLLLTAAYEMKRKYYHDENEQISLLLSCILRNLESDLKRAEEHPLVATVKQFINEHLSEKITLECIGKELFFSPLYCEIIFKRYTGTSIIKYLIQQRIERAKALLLDGTLSLKAIAIAVGFEDYNYVSRVFKRATGTSPKKYKVSISI